MSQPGGTLRPEREVRMDPLPAPLPLDAAPTDPLCLDPLRRFGRRCRLEAGRVLLSEGQHPTAIHILEAGALSLTVTGPSGNRIVLSILGPGDVFGEQALLEPAGEGGTGRLHPFLPECRAVLSCRLLAVHPRDVADALGHDAELSRWLAASLARRLSELYRSLARALSLRLGERTLDLLVALARSWGRPSGAGTGIEVPLTQDDLAAMLGATRESVNRAVRSLERAGMISRSGRCYVVRPGPEAPP